MPERSAGLLLYRHVRGRTEVLLVHPGGPYWASKDLGAWSIPKGAIDPGEDPLAAARREFAEETGSVPPDAGLVPLGEFRQPSRKIVTAFAVTGDFDVTAFRSNTFEMEWPPRSGLRAAFPEADRAAWFGIDEATERINRGQRPILAALSEHLANAERG